LDFAVSLEMTSAIALLILSALLSLGKLGFAGFLDPQCIPPYGPRVIGGQNARRSPWMAYLIRNGGFACGGSLIAYRSYLYIFLNILLKGFYLYL